MKLEYSLFDTLLEPAFVLNAEQKVVYCNETAALIAGLTIRKITRGAKFSDLFTFSEPIEALNVLPTISDPTPYKELTFTTPQGGEGKVQITLQPILDASGEKNWLVFVRDVTLEERLQRKYRAELEQKEDVIKDLEAAKLKLEDYSKNLEQMVADRTRKISELNQTMTALLDSLGQGFFIFGADGKILDVSSKACEHTIECRPNGLDIWDALKVPAPKVEGFKKWMQTVFMEMLPFEDLAPLGPDKFDHSEGKYVSLEYHPLRTDAGMTGIVVVASDITSLVEAQHQAESEKEHAKLIIHMIKSKRQIQRFIKESQGMLAVIQDELAPLEGPRDRENLFRQLHTLKGGAAQFSIQDVAETCHTAENLLNELSNHPDNEKYQALKAKCLEAADNFQNFLTKTKEILGDKALEEERQIEMAITRLSDIAKQVKALPGGVSLGQGLLTEFAMEPVARLLEPYNDVMQTLATKIDKVMAPLEIVNGNVMILPEIYNPLFSTLVHAFRNAVDHGIEAPSARVNAGKPEAGHVKVELELISAIHSEPRLVIRIQDDGGGIDPEKIRAKLLQKGIRTSNESDTEVIQHIFDSQFSTREVVTDVSGRGVGMDAIKSAAEALQGKVRVESKLGQGSCLFIEVPYVSELKTPHSDSKVA